MNYIINDLIGQLIDTLKADPIFADPMTVSRHKGEVNLLMFNNPAYWEGLERKLPFVFIRYTGRNAVTGGKDVIGGIWTHELNFSAYVGTKSEKSQDDAMQEAEIYLAAIFDDWHGRVFKSQQTWASNIPVLSGVQIATTGFKQMSPLFEAGGQDERLIFTLPEITIYETKYSTRLLAYTT